jgi:hypothetical protein
LGLFCTERTIVIAGCLYEIIRILNTIGYHSSHR